MTPDPLNQGVLALFTAFESEPEHPRHVALLACALFDALQSWHQLAEGDRRLLEAAALLHDIGWTETAPHGRAHHKVGARMIRSHPWPGVAPADVNFIAQLARYHRKALPSSEHVHYNALPPADKARLRVLAGLLRIADGLDRRHLQRVRGVAAAVNPGLIVLNISGEVDLTAELEAAARKSDLLRLEFGGEVDLRGP
jgi:exopolyphosphatase / guanosine-5'-triphosphate,3'-diphosphate pyrophosphatase